MIDQLTEAYADYLYGSYDCPDRIVLNGYYRLGSTGGGFRHWWRRLYGTDDNLDKPHLVRLAGRFSRRVKLTCITYFRCLASRFRSIYRQLFVDVASTKG